MMDWLHYPKTLLTAGLLIVAVLVVIAVIYVGASELYQWWKK